MVVKDLIPAFVTLFVVIDPIGLGAIFLGLTVGMDHATRRRIALEACATAYGVLLGSALFGDWLLRQLGIGLAAFRIAGGLLLFAIAFEMVFERRQQRKARGAEEAEPNIRTSIAAVPLAIPLMAGPGAITAVILLSERGGLSVFGIAPLLLVIGAVIAICLAVFLLAVKLDAVMGHTGQIVFSRLLGVLLAALAVQYVVDAVVTILRGAPAGG